MLTSSKPLNWWWTEQLCLFTVGTWTVFVATEGTSQSPINRTLSKFSSILQEDAIRSSTSGPTCSSDSWSQSITANLFYLAIFLSAPSTPRNDRLSRSASPKIWLSVLLSLVTIALSPFTSRQTFLPNLLVMHALLFVPLISGSERSSKQKPGRYSMDTSTLYCLVCIIALGIHARTTLAAIAFLNVDWSKASLSAVVSAIWDTLYSNPAQSSLGWEVIWNSVSFVAFIIARPVGSDLGRSDMRASRSVPFLLLATPVASLGVTAPYVLQPQGGPQHVGHTADKMK